MDQLRFSVRTMPGAFGAAEVDGLDVARDARNDAARATLRAALWEHAVVCVHQPAPPDDGEARALASMIGPIKDPIGRTRDGGSLRYSDDRQVIDAGFVLTDELRAELGDLSFGGDTERPGLFETFHTDDTYTEQPALATVLHARELPAGQGGDTCFLDMRAAFRMLDDADRRSLYGLHMACSYNNHDAFPPRVSAAGPFEALVDVQHPVVRAHPETGAPALYLDLDRATHVVELPVPEGRALLQRLQDHAEAHAPRCAHAWQPHDVLMWDNAAVQHRASGDFPLGEPRRFWRYMIAGPAPVAAAPSDR
jgi:alpha-ketoglutarate-dependent taurine dioxygenase